MKNQTARHDEFKVGDGLKKVTETGEKKAILEGKEEKYVEKIFFFLRESNYFWAFLFVVVIIILFTLHFKFSPPIEIQKGIASPKEIKAPFDFQLIDEVATSQKKEEVKKSIPPVYDFDSEMKNKWVDTLSQNFKKAREVISDYNEMGSKNEKELRQKIEEIFGSEITRFSINQLIKEGFSPSLEEILRDILKKLGSKKIISDEEKLKDLPSIKVRDIYRSGSEWQIKSPSTSEIITLSIAKRLVREYLEEYKEISPSMRASSEEVLRAIIKPNLTFNSLETNSRKEKAVNEVAPLVVFIKKGQTIVKKGEIVDENIKEKIDFLRNTAKRQVNFTKLFTLFIIAILILAFGFVYLKSYKKVKKISVNIFNVSVQLFILTLILTHLFDILFTWLQEDGRNELFQRGDLGLFLVPYAVGAILMTLLIDRHIAIIYSLMITLFVGILLDFNFRISLFALLSSLASIYATASFKQRRLSLSISLFVGVFNSILIVLLLSDDEVFSSFKMVLYASSLGFLSSLPLGLMIISTLLPTIENFYNVVSDIRLLELSNLSHPLLSRLAMETPGTYHHSIMIANLSETVASSIQANPLFCRVSCYYHDIGKILNPNYFVENQKDEFNPHNRLKPEMSALIVKSHVKEGIKLAKSFNIPDAIVDIIPQHHGTRRISFFYDRALTLNDPGKDKLNEADFCYPGPKPQTKEAAIIMLADSLEASIRVLKDPSSHRVETLINEIFEKILLEDQFSECDITLKEIAILKEAFFKAIMGIFSRRISYPQFDFDKGDEIERGKKG